MVYGLNYKDFKQIEDLYCKANTEQLKSVIILLEAELNKRIHVKKANKFLKNNNKVVV